MADGNFTPCALIPVYNHWLVLRDTVADLVAAGLPVILVDDGSDSQCKDTLAAIAGEFSETAPLAPTLPRGNAGAQNHCQESVSLERSDTPTRERGSELPLPAQVAPFSQVVLITRAANGGKGSAIKDGLRAALRLGFSHAVQIDADGQHNRNDVARFLAAAQTNFQALVCGYPVYDDSIPKHRLYGRYASHIWVWINTLSLDIRDSMCGFRVYPVAASCRLLERAAIGDRMEFDGEFIVRWHWSGAPLVQLATAVTYPQDGISHFRLWRDNALISWMHTRLFFAMLIRLPMLLARRLNVQRP